MPRETPAYAPVWRAGASSALQFVSAGLLLGCQLVLLRDRGAAEFGEFQYAYATVVAMPVFITLGLYNLARDERLRWPVLMAAALSVLVFGAAAILLFDPSIAFSGMAYSICFLLSYAFLLEGAFVKRALAATVVLNGVAIVVASLASGIDPHGILVVSSVVTLTVSSWLGFDKLRRLFRNAVDSAAWQVVRSVRKLDVLIFLANGALSQATYLVPLSFAKFAFEASTFGAIAFGLSLGRLPFLIYSGIGSVIAQPIILGRTREVAIYSNMLAIAGTAAVSALVLNMDVFVYLGKMAAEDKGLVIWAAAAFVGAVLWGAVDDIVWLSGYFGLDLVFRVLNVAVTLLACALTYAFDWKPEWFLFGLCLSGIVSYGARHFFVRRVLHSLNFQWGSLVCFTIAILGVVTDGGIFAMVLLNIALLGTVVFVMHNLFATKTHEPV